MTHSCMIWLPPVWHDSFRYLSETRLIHMWHDSFTYEMTSLGATWLIYMLHDSVMISYETWLIYAWHDSFTRDMTHPCVTWYHRLIHTAHASLRCQPKSSARVDFLCVFLPLLFSNIQLLAYLHPSFFFLAWLLKKDACICLLFCHTQNSHQMMTRGLSLRENGKKQKLFWVLSPRPGPDGPNASGWYRRLHEPISPLSLLNCDQLWQLFSRG